MSDNGVSREELTARLEAIEARAETRQVATEGKIDRVLDQMTALAASVADLRQSTKDDAKALGAEVRDDYRNTRWAIIGTAIGTLGIILALIALLWANQGTMTTANGNVLSAFQAGAAAQALKSEPVAGGAAATPNQPKK